MLRHAGLAWRPRQRNTTVRAGVPQGSRTVSVPRPPTDTLETLGPPAIASWSTVTPLGLSVLHLG